MRCTQTEEGEVEHGAELVVGALQAHGGGGEGGAARRQ